MWAALLAAVASPSGYRALGTEPFWSLAIDRHRMRLEQLGRSTLTVRTPRSRTGRRYVTRAMTVTIVHRPCSDGMSDRIFPDTVTIVAGRQTLRGCGGRPVTPAAG